LARGDAETLARALGPLRGSVLTARVSALARQAGVARATLTVGSRTLADVGDRTAIAPGEAVLVQSGARRRILVTVSELNGSQYVRELTAPGVAVVVREGRRVLGASLPAAQAASLDNSGNVTAEGRGYRAVGQDFPASGRTRVTVAVVSALSATSSTLAGSRAAAAVLIIAFLLLAFAFSMLASRALQARLRGFLQAARRLGSGDFSPRSRSRAAMSFRPWPRSSTACRASFPVD
jgi:hypothetical protein